MKKIAYLFLLSMFIISFAGFRGCTFDLGSALFGIMYRIDFSKVSGSGDNIEEIYGITVGAGGKIYTSDGRPPAPWILRQSGVTQDLKDVKACPDSAFCYVVGNQGVVLRSTDKGHNWNIIRVPNSNYTDLNGVDIIPQPKPLGMRNIICTGNNGTVLKSSNNGSNWSWINLSINTTKKLNSVSIVGEGYFAVTGDSGAIYRTLDSGATWENRSISVSVSLKKIVSPRYDRFCAVGTNGAIYLSTDYGYTWGAKVSGTNRTFRDVIFSSVDSGVAAGDAGTVRYTTNGGLTWTSDPFLNGLTNRNITSVAQVDVNTVNSLTTISTPEDNIIDTNYFLSVSSEPFIGIEPISNFIAEFFSLKQNYPNPFNPETKIRFDVPANVKGQTSNVNITIYDITGKKISTLVNEQLRPGEYEVKWDGSPNPSGVYFYRITTDGFILTKKMMLLK